MTIINQTLRTMFLCAMLFVSVGGLVGADNEVDVDKKKLPKAFHKLKEGDIFQHPTPAVNCQTDKECQNVAKRKCVSAKAKFKSCSEIYTSSMVTTCVCL